MNHKLFSSLTASLLIATLGVPPSGNANTPESTSQGTEPAAKPLRSKLGSIETPAQAVSALTDGAKTPTQVVKVGEQQAQTAAQATAEVVAKVHPHEISGREAATLYVKNIPILTFMGAKRATPTDTKIGTQSDSSDNPPAARAKSLGQTDTSNPSLSTILQSSQTFAQSTSNELNLESLEMPAFRDDPVWRATLIAARLNQLHRNGINADQIKVSWDNQKNGESRDRYTIQADRLTIAVIDSDTILPDTTRNLETDALQATNRLRRVLGNATPLHEVTGKPAARGGQEISLGPIRIRLKGFASWYGPGFHGNPSASGERFNQHAMTAAHRTLPFGTRVVVTNLDNGQSIVVRINDRGPFHSNRIIDLSTAAARIIGLVQSGIAPVRLDVIDTRSASAVGN